MAAKARSAAKAKTSKSEPGAWWDTLVALLACALLSAAAVRFCYQRGYILLYGDAQAHLNIARRLFDSRTPGFDQLGTVWLPLPHLLMAKLASDDWMWRTGLAGAIPSAVGFVLAATLLFAVVKLSLGSRAAAFAAAGLFALNPNLLYLQSTPMNEPVFLACLMATLYFTLLFSCTQSVWALVAAGLAACAGTLTRYEGWIVLPFAAVYILIAARKRRLLLAVIFSVLAAAGPLAWFAHNAYYEGDALAFYRGPYSAKAIQRGAPYPGDHNWPIAWQQYRAAGAMVLGYTLVWIGVIGAFAALARRAFWPMTLLLLPPAFYVWSLHSGGTPIFVPHLTPFNYYNTRYGLALLPPAAFGAAALVAWTPFRFRPVAAVVVIAVSLIPWLLDPRPENVVTWQESEVLSRPRRLWTAEAAVFLRANYRQGTGVFTTFSDLTGIFQSAGIPLRDTLTWDNWPWWPAAVARPDLFLKEEWAVAVGGDPVQTAILRAYRHGPRYTLRKIIMVKGAPVVEIYRRESQRGLTSPSP